MGAALLLMPGVAGAQQSRPVECGKVITKSTRLVGDVGPCSDEGIVLGSDNVKLDLNGFRVFGTPEPEEGARIFVSQRRNVHITDGTVSDFGDGIAILSSTETRS